MPLFAYRKLPAWLRLMRPEQWTKNCFVMVAFFFAFWDPTQNFFFAFWDPTQESLNTHFLEMFIRVVAATAIFCLVSSSVYAFNDCRDRVADSQHPVKKYRPVASGEMSPVTATILAVLLCGASCTAAFFLNKAFFLVTVVYLVLQIAYSCYLKQIPLLDVFMIATGFVLRAFAGAKVLDAKVSPWFLLCTFLIALFLAICKRRQEKTIRGEDEQRKTLQCYSREFLNHLIAITAAATIVSYSLYTLSPDTIEKFGTSNLGLTIPFVIFGIFRYMFLVFNTNEGERPEHTLFTDPAMITTICLYLVATVLIFVFR